MAELLLALTPRLRSRASGLLLEQQRQVTWHGQLPVLVLERCWLQLRVVPVQELATQVPPDSSGDAPELSRFRQLREQGLDSLAAQEQCWQEFGRAACSEALRRFWRAQEQGNHGWTLERYLQLLDHYRQSIERPGAKPLPLLVLARAGSGDSHQLQWYWPNVPSVGHTCP